MKVKAWRSSKLVMKKISLCSAIETICEKNIDLGTCEIFADLGTLNLFAMVSGM